MSEANNPDTEAQAEASQELAPDVEAEGADHQTEAGTDSNDGEPAPGVDDAEGQAAEHPEADGHEEIEFDGDKFLVPPKLKEAFLRQSDYTAKTQAVADQKRQLDTERQTWEANRAAQQVEAATQLRAEIGKVATLENQMAPFKDVDWRQAQAHIAALADPTEQVRAQAEYNLAWTQFTSLERELGEATKSLSAKEQELAQTQTTQVQAAMRETLQTLQRDIPDFNLDRATQIVDHGVKAFGLTGEEARQMADPRIWKLLDSDRTKSAEIVQLKAQLAKVSGQRQAQDSNKAAQVIKPAVRIGGGSAPPTGLSDKLSDEEWTKRRNAQVAKRRA